MNIGVILASGIGTRVGANIPKQFIEINGKPILAYTLEIFQKNENIDAIEIVCHKDWIETVKCICNKFSISKCKWICVGGNSFQKSTFNGVLNLKNKISKDDIVVISFGVSPMTPQEDINDSIKVCKEHGNAIASQDIDLCTCIKDDEYSTTQNIIRENLKGFANPWTFKYGELLEAYEYANDNNILDKLEPHTTSLYLALGKRLWFSQCTSAQCKITKKNDLDIFEGYLLLKEKRGKND
ncbi:4-diphosphocytidyl-2-methyl-D-erythritol synthase [Firmicutes bacterium CAG:449]|nr:4-diphosphocytidyl-2-methyl-D-erythritol synthase [Firmicutes bacterium CAG:449]